MISVEVIKPDMPTCRFFCESPAYYFLKGIDVCDETYKLPVCHPHLMILYTTIGELIEEMER